MLEQPAQLEPAFRALGLPAPTAVARLKPPSANDVYRVDSPAGPLVVLFPTSGRAESLVRHAAALERVRGLPVVPWFRRLPEPWVGAVCPLLPGVQGAALVQRDPAAAGPVFEVLGKILSVLEQRTFPAAIPDLAADEPRGTWRSACLEQARSDGQRALRAGLDVGIPVDGLVDRLDALGGALDSVPRFSLVHGDLHPSNTLFDADLRLTGVLDWEQARVGDPLVDWAGLIEQSPRILAPIVRGYGLERARIGLSEGLARLRAYGLCRVLHQLGLATEPRVDASRRQRLVRGVRQFLPVLTEVGELERRLDQALAGPSLPPRAEGTAETDAGRPLWHGLWQHRLVREENRAGGEGPSGPDVGALLGPGFFEESWAREPTVLDAISVPGDWPGIVAELVVRLGGTGRVGTTGPNGREMSEQAPIASVEDVLEAVGRRLVQVRDAHWELPEIAHWQRAFSSFFGCPVTTGLYLNGPGAPGFTEHHDAHHVFALQLAGAKRWFVGAPILMSPSRRYDFAGSGTTAAQPLQVLAGQLLYLPPGTRHRAECSGEVSVHVTFGVHTPRALDAIEALLRRAGRFDPRLRAELPWQRGPTGMRWHLPQDLAGLLERLDREPAGGELVTPEGVRIDSGMEIERGPVPGEWPVRDGRFVPLVVDAQAPWLSRARAAADALVRAVSAIRAVYARGSVLEPRDPSKRFDLDLVLVLHRPGTPEDHAAVVEALRAHEDPKQPFDLRLLTVDELRQGTASCFLQLCLAARSAHLAGEPLWSQPPPIDVGPPLARALAEEWMAQWRQVVAHLYEQPIASDGRRFSPEAVAWLQKRSLRMVALEALAVSGRFTRHPVGCVQLIEAHVADLAPAARTVCEGLLARHSGNEAAVAAIELGAALAERWG